MAKISQAALNRIRIRGGKVVVKKKPEADPIIEPSETAAVAAPPKPKVVEFPPPDVKRRELERRAEAARVAEVVASKARATKRREDEALAAKAALETERKRLAAEDKRIATERDANAKALTNIQAVLNSKISALTASFDSRIKSIMAVVTKAPLPPPPLPAKKKARWNHKVNQTKQGLIDTIQSTSSDGRSFTHTLKRSNDRRVSNVITTEN